MTSEHPDHCAECGAEIASRPLAGRGIPTAASADCAFLPRRGLVCIPCANRCACGADVPRGAASIIDAATDRVLCDACAMIRFARPGGPAGVDFTRREVDARATRDGVLLSPDGPGGQCPAIRLSDCPRCAAIPGQRCAGIDRNDEVHVERVWRCAARWEHAN